MPVMRNPAALRSPAALHGSIARRAAAEVDLDAVSLRHLHDSLNECLRLLAGHHASVRRAAHAFLPVLITLMLRKRAGTQPWLTDPIWPGWPFPSKKLAPIM